MEVICIDASCGVADGEIPIFKEFDVLNVIGVDEKDVSYQLREDATFADGQPKYWFKKRFIPLSSIDEKEISKQREKQLL